jgi:hypothetical protein
MLFIDEELDNMATQMRQMRDEITTLRKTIAELENNKADKSNEMMYVRSMALSMRVINIEKGQGLGNVMINKGKDDILQYACCCILEGRRVPQDIICINMDKRPMAIIYCWNDETIVAFYGRKAVFIKYDTLGPQQKYENMYVSNFPISFTKISSEGYIDIGSNVAVIQDMDIYASNSSIGLDINCRVPHKVKFGTSCHCCIYACGRLTYDSE